MASRPFINDSLQDLHERAKQSADSRIELDRILSELARRKTKGAIALRKSVFQRMEVLEEHPDDPPAWEPLEDGQLDLLVVPAGDDGHDPKDHGSKTIAEELDSETKRRYQYASEAISALREKLLDLSRRNPLVSFKHSTRSASQLRIVDEKLDKLFEALDRSEMGFEHLPGEDTVPADEKTHDFTIKLERAKLTDPEYLKAIAGLEDDEDDATAWQNAERELRHRVRAELGLAKIEYGKKVDVRSLALAHGFDPSYDLNRQTSGHRDHHHDDRIRVLLTEKQLDTRLKAIEQRYRSHQSQTGLHTLFLCFAFLEYPDDGAKDGLALAPLILLPVELRRQRKRHKYEFSIARRDEEPEINIALREKLKRPPYGLELPELAEGDSPSAYIERIEDLLEEVDKPKFRVRHFATLAVLPFPRMVLWRDLDPANWPANAFGKHDLLAGLLAATESTKEAGLRAIHNIEELEARGAAPPIVCPADSSQHSLIVDTLNGESLAVEGPPGTGKSQSITNVIAAALDSRKKVLFVAEKQAALDVVRERLEKLGFGPLMLDLHSERLTKKNVALDLQDRLARRGSDDGEAELLRSQLHEYRDQIRTYLTLINKPLGKLGKRTFDLLWRRTRVASQVGDGTVVEVRKALDQEQILAMDAAPFQEALKHLQSLSEALLEDHSESGDQGNAWLRGGPLPTFNQTEQADALADAATKLLELGNMREECIKDTSFALPDDVSALAKWSECLLEIEVDPVIAERDLRAALLETGNSRDLLKAFYDYHEIVRVLELAHSAPSSISKEKIEKLGQSLDALNVDGSFTFDDLETRAREFESLNREVKTALGAQERLAQSDIDFANCDLRDIHSTSSILADFVDSDASNAMFHVPALLEDAALRRAKALHLKASKLRDDRDDLSKKGVKLSILLEDAKLLETAAETIENSSWFSRLFSRDFREARNLSRRHAVAGTREDISHALRLAAQILVGEGELVETLRAASMTRSGTDLSIDLNTKTLVQSVEHAQEAWTQLAPLKHEAFLESLLVATELERRALKSAFEGLLTATSSLLDRGLTVRSLKEAQNTIQSEIEILGTTLSLCSEIGLKRSARLKDQDSRIDRKYSEYRQLADRLDGSKPTVLAFFEGTDFDPSGLAAAVGLADRLAESSEMQSAEASSRLAEKQEPLKTLKRAREHCETILGQVSAFVDANRKVEAACSVDAQSYLTSSQRGHGILVQASELTRIAEDVDARRRAAALQAIRSQVEESVGHPMLALLDRGVVNPRDLKPVFEAAVSDGLLQHFVGGDGKALSRLSGMSMTRARDEFRKIDRRLHGAEARRIIAKRLQDPAPQGIGSGPKSQWTQLSLIENEASKKTRHIPIRDLTRRAAQALQALKPLWMMSPGSVAQYVPPGAAEFDLAIVDEASQMKPEYAISPFMRAKQILVVGDTKQLPPTDFFDGSDDDHDDEGMEVQQQSILELAEARLPGRRLNWHYRSQHEDLIAFSNRNFYDNGLVVFPTPRPEDELLGVRHSYVGGVYSSSVNEEEAQRIVEEAVSLMIRYPDESLGIATMNVKQAELIRNEIDQLALEQKAVASYIDRWADSLERFFVKNLENVQGDERDIILISTVYGPDENGNVAQRFGPINRVEGGRRLNVLASRAKKSMRVFTSLNPGDIKITSSSSQGLMAFHAFLNQVSGGVVEDDPQNTNQDYDSDFEKMVADRLISHGYRVVPQVGVEGYRIDLGVKHKDLPLGYIAGIECDGATYHNAPSVRDRDQVRQSVLENLGWNIHRIWSTDWFQDSDRSMAKMLEKLAEWSDELAARWSAGESADNEIAREEAAEEPDASSDAAYSEPESTETPQLEPSPSTSMMADKEAKEVGTDHDEEECASEDILELSGKRRTLDDFEYVETVPHRIWAVVDKDENVLGDVECLRRGSSGVKLYGGQTQISLPEYESRPSGKKAQKFSDLYAALRHAYNQSNLMTVS